MSLKLTPFVLNWPSITAGDTYPGFQIVGTDEPDGNDLVRVRMQVRDANGTVAVDYDSDDTGITINDPETWDFNVDDLTAPATGGLYKYDIETTDSAGVVATIIRGNWPIIDQVTA
jgi:hypothetical protein